MRRYFFYVFLLMIVLAACKKDGNSSKVPKITFQSVFPNTIKSGSNEDSVNISFKIEDGDADIGNDPKAGIADVYLTDTRDTTNKLNFFLPAIPSDFKDPSKGFVGDVRISIKGTFLVLDSLHVNGDTLHFDVYMKDIAGNESNHFTTPDIYITP